MYGEVVVDRPIEEVWAAVQEYHKWVPEHKLSQRKTIRGEPGRPGEVVEILKPGATEPIYSETVRIRPPQIIDGSHQVANIVWAVYDPEVSFSLFSDFGVREYNGKTIFYRSVYCSMPPSSEDLLKTRQAQAEGKSDGLSEAMVVMREQIEEYLQGRQ